MDMWTIRLRCTEFGSGQCGAARLAVPTAEPFAPPTRCATAVRQSFRDSIAD